MAGSSFNSINLICLIFFFSFQKTFFTNITNFIYSNDLFDLLLQEMLKELFPSWEAVSTRYREVVLFAAGLMKDSRPLVQFVYEMQVEYYLYVMRIGFPPDIDVGLFKWLHVEASVQLVDDPLHNKYINCYSVRDTTPIDYPSTIYQFVFMSEDVVLGEYKAQSAEKPECAMFIHRPEERVTKNLVCKCRTISEHQAVTDFHIYRVHCDDATEAEALILSRNIQSLNISDCKLSSSFMRNLLHQLHDCVILTNLSLSDMDLRKVKKDLNKLLDNLVSSHVEGLTQKELKIAIVQTKLSKKLLAKWNKRCQ